MHRVLAVQTMVTNGGLKLTHAILYAVQEMDGAQRLTFAGKIWEDFKEYSICLGMGGGGGGGGGA